MIFKLFVASLLLANFSDAKRYVVVHDHPTPSADFVKNKVKAHGNAPIHHDYGSIGGAAFDLTAAQATTLQSVDGLKLYADAPVQLVSSLENNPPSWGIDRLDNVHLPLNQQYYYPKTAAKGANVFIIDTGISIHHPEFNVSRAFFLKNYVNDGINDDCNGHGTHVASIVAGTTVGVAKGARVNALKVLGCNGSGSFSDVIAAVQYVIDYQQTAVNKRTIINMSLGGGYYQPVNDIVAAAAAANITVVVAAGNSNADACSSSPSSAPSAITVAASESNDNRAYYSNFGSCVDIYAPGSGIYGAWLNNGYATLSGTSMASPHAAGLAALYMGSKVAVTPSAVYNRMTTDATVDTIVGNIDGTVNRLVYLKNNFN